MDVRKIYQRALLIGLLSASILAFGQGSPNIIWIGHQDEDRINNVVFNPSGDTLISGSSDRLIKLWRVSDGKVLQTFNASAPFVHESSIEWLSISRDGTKLASCSYKVVNIWSLPQGTQRSLFGHGDWVVSVSFSPDGQLLASASFDNTVRIWRVSDGTLLKTIANPRQMRAVAFSPDGTILAGAGGDADVHFWRTSDWTQIRVLEGHTDDIYTIAFSPDGTRIASGGYDRTVKVWSVSSGALLYTLGGNNGNIYGIAFSPDSSQLAYTDGEGNTIRIHRVSDGARLRLFDQNVNQVQCLAYSPTGLLAYGRLDERVVLARLDGSSPPPPPPPPPPTSNWTLSLTVSGTGNIQVSPTPNGPNGTYLDGTVVQLTAVPIGTNRFLGWSGAVSGTANPVSMTMNGNKSVGASFTFSTQTEIIWQNSNGQLAGWYMDGQNFLGAVRIHNGIPVAPGWHFGAAADFNNDGQKDFVFYHDDGSVAIWLMSGDNPSAATRVSGLPGWRIAGAGDFNADGQADILLQQFSGGQLELMLMRGTAFVGQRSVNDGRAVSSDWRAVAVADFDNDGKADILWQRTDGTAAIWFMNGEQTSHAMLVNGDTTFDSDWRLVGAGHFSADRQTDILWQHRDGYLAAWLLFNGNYRASLLLRNGQSVAPEWNVMGVR